MRRKTDAVFLLCQMKLKAAFFADAKLKSTEELLLTKGSIMLTVAASFAENAGIKHMAV